MKWRHVGERLAGGLDLPVDALASGLRVIVTSGLQAELENIESLVELTQTVVTVRGKHQLAVLSGQGLELDVMAAGRMVIRGTIHAVTLEDL